MKRILLLAALVSGVAAIPAGVTSAVTTSAASAQNYTCVNTNVPPGTWQNVIVPAGDWCNVVAVHVLGSVQAVKSAGLGIGGGTEIDGNVQAVKTQAANDTFGTPYNVICNSIIKGNVQIVNSTANAPWNIGVNDPALLMNGSCDTVASWIGGNIQFNGNQAQSYIGLNDVEGNAQCVSNAFAPSDDGEMNGADGPVQGQCAPIFGPGDAGGEPQSDSD